MIDQRTDAPSLVERLLALPATDLASALGQVAQLLAEARASDKVDCFVFDPLRCTLVALGTSDTPMARQQRALGLDRLPLANGGRSVEVFQTGRPFLTGRADEDAEELVGIKRALGAKSTVAVPLDIGGDRRGVVQLTSAERDAYDEADLRFLLSAARWVGAVAHRAELVDEIATRAGESARQQAAEELVTVLAHDLGNLLSPLAGHLELLKRRAAREQRLVDLSDATAAGRIVHRLQRLIGEVLDVARIDQGLLSLGERPLDLVPLAGEVAQLLEAPATPLRVRGPDECVVWADPDRLRQALENLVLNAIRHSPPGAEVLVELGFAQHEEGPWATVQVSDQGPGISEQLRPHLFTRFARGPGSSGLGLGLYLARSIVEAHGGTLTVESGPGGVGTRFTIALPVRPRDRHEAPRPRLG